jgi:hypothetical protein
VAAAALARRGLHLGLFAGVVILLTSAVVVAASGRTIGAGLILVTPAPIVVVVGYEWVGHRHAEEVLQRALGG